MIFWSFTPPLGEYWYIALQILAALAILNSQLQLLNTGRLRGLAGKTWFSSMCLLYLTQQANLGMVHGYGKGACWNESKLMGQRKLHGWAQNQEMKKMEIRTITVINLHNQFYGPWYMLSTYSLERIYNVTSNMYVYVFFTLFISELYILFLFSVLGYILGFSSWGNWFWAIYTILLFSDCCSWIYIV